MSDTPKINIDQLRIGLYVFLDLNWFQHPFALSHFKIKSEDQIKTIRGLGLKSVRYDPALSDSDSPPSTAAGESSANDEPSPFVMQALAAKRAMMERIRVQREAAARIETAFVNTAKTVHEVEKNLLTQPAETVHQATQLVKQIADSILCAPELAIHVMGDRLGGEELYFHSLNVTMLSLMAARDLRLPPEVIAPLGMGALFHDIGRKEIPNRILMKMEPLTQAERHLYEMHCQYGVELGQRLGFAPPILGIIREHHEMFDGSGYPQKLKGEAIGLLSRIVGMANYYDELCNPLNLASALTPHEALSLMFAKLRNKFDPKLLQVFIRCLGVYPPGTIVQLSNGVIGMVATVNTQKPMKPMIVIYDEGIPKDDAITVDLERETDLNIAKAIRPAQVPIEIYNYLSPRKRVSYYFDASQPGQEKASP
ncbi:MAG: metal-dependent phosphohydrolase [Betaproteobacteria bacterium HGW-Betaproteobacteria-7]|jgi:putative nucleotidyltransferase with HDIG domain|nr:MAG: metal-dependent phosphohydrolase [Betaproteobacteria bacterium HGW-Betaproteobacteria-7]